MTRAPGSKYTWALPSASGVSTRPRACSVCSTSNARASERATTLTPLTSPGIVVRKLPNSTISNTCRASLGSPRYHGSSHMRGSMSHAIQRWLHRTRRQSETRVPFDSATGPPVSTGRGGLRAELANVGANRAPYGVGLEQLLDVGCLFECPPIVLVQDHHQVIRLLRSLLRRHAGGPFLGNYAVTKGSVVSSSSVFAIGPQTGGGRRRASAGCRSGILRPRQKTSGQRVRRFPCSC